MQYLKIHFILDRFRQCPLCLHSAVSVAGGKGYFAECGLRFAESCQGVICGKFDADFFSAE